MLASNEFVRDVADAGYARRLRRRALVLGGTALIAILLFFIDVLTGPALLHPAKVLAAILGHDTDEQVGIIVWNLRLPIALLAVLVGASLGAAGAEMQTILHNPLASPYTLGLAAAAGFGAALAIVLGVYLPIPQEILVPLAAFILCGTTCGLILVFTKGRHASPEAMVLVGIALLFLFQSLQALMQYLASPEVLQQIVFWMFGSLNRATWPKVGIVALVILLVTPVLMRDSWRLTALRMGEVRAAALGIQVQRLRFRTFFVVSLLTATAVCFAGTIGFIGLVAPHIARSLTGEDQRFFLPMSMGAGAALLSAASIVSKSLVPGAIFPVGIVTAVVGVPAFLWIVVGNKRQHW